VRAARAAALLLALPFAGCIFAVDEGGRSGLEKRVERLEKRMQDLEKERGVRHHPGHVYDPWEQ